MFNKQGPLWWNPSFKSHSSDHGGMISNLILEPCTREDFVPWQKERNPPCNDKNYITKNKSTHRCLWGPRFINIIEHFCIIFFFPSRVANMEIWRCTDHLQVFYQSSFVSWGQRLTANRVSAVKFLLEGPKVFSSSLFSVVHTPLPHVLKSLKSSITEPFTYIKSPLSIPYNNFPGEI